MRTVLVEMSPVSYMALCALVRDALINDSDATPLLKKVEKELAAAMANGNMPPEMADLPQKMEALRSAGFAD